MSFFPGQARPKRLMHKISWDETSGADHPANLEEGWMMLKTRGYNRDADYSLPEALNLGLMLEQRLMNAESNVVRGLSDYEWDGVPAPVQKSAEELYHFMRSRMGDEQDAENNHMPNAQSTEPRFTLRKVADTTATEPANHAHVMHGSHTHTHEDGQTHTHGHNHIDHDPDHDGDYHSDAFHGGSDPEGPDADDMRKATHDNSNPPGGLISDLGSGQNGAAIARILRRALNRSMPNVQGSGAVPMDYDDGYAQNDPVPSNGGSAGQVASPAANGYSQNDPVRKVFDEDIAVMNGIQTHWPAFIQTVEGVVASNLPVELKKAAVLGSYQDLLAGVTESYEIQEWLSTTSGPMQKRTFSADQRKKLAAAGKAKSDGSYPVENCADVRNAVADYGRSGGSPSDKAHIKSRAKAEGCDLPASWK